MVGLKQVVFFKVVAINILELNLFNAADMKCAPVNGMPLTVRLTWYWTIFWTIFEVVVSGTKKKYQEKHSMRYP